jgi:xylan 1,4-beta-xylosidase
MMMHRIILPFVAACLLLGPATVGLTAPPIEIDLRESFHVELTAASPTGEASIREHSITWHPVKKKYYLIADVVPLGSPHHPDTYNTELHLWSSVDLAKWTYHGVAVRKGRAGTSYDGYGVASPAGMAFFRGRLFVPFSARRTSRFEQRSIGLAVSGSDPEKLPWAKTNSPISDLPGDDDDPALLVIPDDDSLHLFHRATGPRGHRIVHTASRTPDRSGTWPAAQTITPRPRAVRAQELTGVFVTNGRVHLLVIEHLYAGGMRIAHLASDTPYGPFNPTDPTRRYLPPDTQPQHLAYGGHITPVEKEGTLSAFFWTVPQQGGRYGLQGHPVRTLYELWRTRLGVNSPTNVIVGRLDDGAYLYVPGRDAKHGRGGTVEALSAHGRPLWQSSAGAGREIGAYLQWVDSGDRAGPLVASSFVTKYVREPGGARFVGARDGVLVKEIRNVTHFGNNNSIVADLDFDLDNDNRPEFVYADQSTLTCYDLPNFRMRWRFSEDVRFCWSLPVLVDTNRDGKAEIVFGSEYNTGDGTSSMLAIDARGKPVWRSDGHAEDLGSTPVFVADVDGDGENELLKVGLDLEHRQKQEWNHLYVFDMSGKLKSKIELGFTGIAIGDMDGDGHLEGVGLTNTRDGGHNGHREVRCIDLAAGRVKWTTPVGRAYLDTNSPIMADLNRDGKLDAIVGTGNPAGYARLPNSQPWGDLYVLDWRGEILQHIKLPGWPVNLAICDVNDDGLNELAAVIDGLPGSLALYQTKDPATRNDWPTPFGSPRRDGTMGQMSR